MVSAAGVARLSVGVLCGGLGVLVAAAHVPDADAPRRLLPLLAGWLGLALALAFEPAPRGTLRRTVVASAVAALCAAALALVVATRQEPPWWLPAATALPLGSQLACAAWTGHGVLAALLLGFATLPASLALLLARRAGRQLEWQAAAAALGPVVVGPTLFPELLTAPHLWVLALSGAPVGLGAYLLDRVHLGERVVPRFPEPDLADDAPGRAVHARHRGVLLAALVVAGAAWVFLVGGVLSWLTPPAVEPGAPDVAAVLEGVRAKQEAYRAKHGEYARVLGLLEGVDRDLAGGYTQGYVVRFGRFDAGSWAIAADPIPAKMGWRSFRLVGPAGALEVADGPFPLERPR